MYKEKREQIHRQLGVWLDGGVFSGETMYVFGVGEYTREILAVLGSSGIRTKHILDNDARKEHSYCHGVEVILPGNTQKSDIKEATFIICSQFGNEMRRQLMELGVGLERIFTIELSSFGSSLKHNLKALREGRQIYKKIKKAYPNHEILLCPYTGTGDIYLIGTFLQQYLKKENIDKYVLVVVSGACEKVARIFDIPDVYRIDGPEACYSLTKYYMVCPDKCVLRMMNDCWGDIYTDPTQWIRGLHGLDFAEMFRKFVFNLDSDAMPEHPVFADKSNEINEIAKKYKLKQKKTVVLAPYATTLADCPNRIWEEIADTLKKEGYAVVTNGIGDREPAVRGTEQVSFSLDIAPQFVSWAGGFIGIRSGLCDIISGADAKKVVLYDKANYFFNCSAYDYFSLRKMGLSSDAVEIEYDNTDMDALRDQILNQFI